MSFYFALALHCSYLGSSRDFARHSLEKVSSHEWKRARICRFSTFNLFSGLFWYTWILCFYLTRMPFLFAFDAFALFFFFVPLLLYGGFVSRLWMRVHLYRCATICHRLYICLEIKKFQFLIRHFIPFHPHLLLIHSFQFAVLARWFQTENKTTPKTAKLTQYGAGKNAKIRIKNSSTYLVQEKHRR